MLLRSKNKRDKRTALATLVPTLFNANEPLMFGLPVVLNPYLGVPFVLAPLVLAVVTWEAMTSAWSGEAGVVSAFDAFRCRSASSSATNKDWRSVGLAARQHRARRRDHLRAVRNGYTSCTGTQAERKRRMIEALLAQFPVSDRVARAAREGRRARRTVRRSGARNREARDATQRSRTKATTESDLAGASGTATTTPRARGTSRCSRASSARNACSRASRS